MENIRRLLMVILGHIGSKAQPRFAAKDALMERAYHYFAGAMKRLNHLYDKWRAGHLPKPRKPRPGRTSKPTDRPRFPSTRAWLASRAIANVEAGYLHHYMTTEPDFIRFLAEVPQAGRILRPLCHALGTDLPPSIRVDARPRKKRVYKPKPKPEPFKVPIPEGARGWIPKHLQKFAYPK